MRMTGRHSTFKARERVCVLAAAYPTDALYKRSAEKLVFFYARYRSGRSSRGANRARAETPSRAVYLLRPFPRAGHSSARSQLHLPHPAAAAAARATSFHPATVPALPRPIPALPLLPPSPSSHRRPSRAAVLRRTAPARCSTKRPQDEFVI